MRTTTVHVTVGENVGPVDWNHPTAASMPDAWRAAEINPSGFTFDYGHGARDIIAICMYDGWPYWQPRPAVCYVGPLGVPEWHFFDSYGVRSGSIIARQTASLAQEKESV